MSAVRTAHVLLPPTTQDAEGNFAAACAEALERRAAQLPMDELSLEVTQYLVGSDGFASAVRRVRSSISHHSTPQRPQSSALPPTTVVVILGDRPDPMWADAVEQFTSDPAVQTQVRTVVIADDAVLSEGAATLRDVKFVSASVRGIAGALFEALAEPRRRPRTLASPRPLAPSPPSPSVGVVDSPGRSLPSVDTEPEAEAALSAPIYPVPSAKPTEDQKYGPRPVPAGEDTPAPGDPGNSGPLLGSEPLTNGWPDTLLDAVEGPLFAVRAATCRGRAHRYDNTPRQDAYFVKAGPGGEMVMAVADGVSERKLSHLAAQIASRHACEQVVGELTAGTPPGQLNWQQMASAVVERIVVRAAAINDQVHDGHSASMLMATTLFVAVASPSPEGIVVHGAFIGDSSGWILRSGAWHPLNPVKNSGAVIASSQTKALPRHALMVPVAAKLGPGDAIVLMSDGVGDAIDDGTGTVARHLACLWESPPGIHAFGAAVDFQARSFDDDRTAVALWPKL